VNIWQWTLLVLSILSLGSVIGRYGQPKKEKYGFAEIISELIFLGLLLLAFEIIKF